MQEINLELLIDFHSKQFFCLGMNLYCDPSRWQVKTTRYILKYYKADLIGELPFKITAPKSCLLMADLIISLTITKKTIWTSCNQ